MTSCSHPTRQVDRVLCPAPCTATHLRCAACGAAVGGCPFESDGLHERLVATLGAQLPRAHEWQVRDSRRSSSAGATPTG